MKKVLVTGARGQLGIALNKLIDKNKFEIVNTDISNSDTDHYVTLDICNEENVNEIINNYRPDVIINCGAMTAVDLCETMPDEAYQINAIGPKLLSRAAKRIDAVLFQISTDYVFDGQANKPYLETDETNPTSVYGNTKLQGEKFALEENNKTYIIRTAWLYGEGKNFVNTMIKLSNSNTKIRVVSDQYGNPTSALELARAIVVMLKQEFNDRSKSYGIYHATNEGIASWYEFAAEIFKYLNINIEVEPISSGEYPTPTKRPNYSALENKALLDYYNYKMSDWKKSLYEYLDYCK